MSYVIAAYVATFGTLVVYASRLVIRSRHIAAALLRTDPPNEHGAPNSPSAASDRQS